MLHLGSENEFMKVCLCDSLNLVPEQTLAKQMLIAKFDLGAASLSTRDSEIRFVQ